MPLLHTAHLRVRPDIVDAFRDRLARHAATTLAAEPGCHGFVVRQERTDPTLFLLYETYADDDALDAHRVSPHYLAFREDVKEWVVERSWWFWAEPVA